jgi:hypothetical protein
MRSLFLSLAALTVAAGTALAQTPPAPAAAPAAKDEKSEKLNANPCRDEVAAALQKLRKTSWFRMDTAMITETGPTKMQVDYVLPDKMHQRVSSAAGSGTTEVVLIGDEAWGNEGKGWQALSTDLTQQLKAQMYENVVEQQADVGNYSCKGKTQFDGRDVLSYKLETEAVKDESKALNEAFRMFYIDATTGMPVSIALLAPGRETKPLFKTSYSYPLDIRIEAPKDVVKDGAAPAPK